MHISTPVEKLYDLKKLKTGRQFRFAKEHMGLHRLCQWSEYIDYEVKGEKAPVYSTFELTYHVKSIIGVDDDFNPKFGEKHVVEIQLPANYPQEPARCKALSDVWHPNIKWHGNYKGRICTNNKEFGKLFSLAELALRVGEMLQYKNYHAFNTPPYPEDEKVARWVREFAEDKGIISLAPDGAIDDKELKMPPDDWQHPEASIEPDDPEGPSILGPIKIKKYKSKDTKEEGDSPASDIRFRKKDS